MITKHEKRSNLENKKRSNPFKKRKRDLTRKILKKKNKKKEEGVELVKLTEELFFG